MSSSRAILTALTLSTAMFLQPAHAQEGSENVKPWLVSIFANYGHWGSGDTGGDGSQSLAYTQVAYDTQKWGVYLTGTYVNTSYKPSDTFADRLNINSLTDTAIATYYSMKLADVSLRAGLDFTLPTGKHAYSTSELAKVIVEDISQDLMLVNSYGAGFNMTPHFMASWQSSWGAAGIGARYTFAGEFDPTTGAENDNFKPGDRFFAVATGMVNITENKDFALLTATYTKAANDRQGGQDIFHSGDLLGLEGRYIRRWAENWESSLGLIARWQGKNESIGENGALGPETGNANGNSVELFFNNVYIYSDELTLTGVVGLRNVSANGYAEGDALYDAGRLKMYLEPGIGWRLTPSLWLSGKLRYARLMDKKDAFSPRDATYNIYNLDMGLVHTF
ncbi:MAG: hypothetical protein HY751_02775 [Nitrospinae bacterium]|nr:hypothetical protein [Nitrospinota bacterium]